MTELLQTGQAIAAGVAIPYGLFGLFLIIEVVI